MLLDELVQVIENLALTFREWQHRAPPVVESDRGRKRQVGIPGRGGRTICEWKAKINLHVKPGCYTRNASPERAEARDLCDGLPCFSCYPPLSSRCRRRSCRARAPRSSARKSR